MKQVSNENGGKNRRAKLRLKQVSKENGGKNRRAKFVDSISCVDWICRVAFSSLQWCVVEAKKA